MTKISYIHEGLISLVDGALSEYAELPNPYDLDNNPEIFMKSGFGVSIGGGDNDERSVTCHRFMRRNFVIKLVNKITTTRINTESLKTLQKEILEDQETVIAALRDDITLSGYCIEMDYTADGGVQYLDTGRQKYFVLETTVECLYSVQD